MEPVQYARALRRRWWVIPLAMMVGALAAFVTSETVRVVAPGSTGKLYEATTILWDQSAGTGLPIPLVALPQTLGFPAVVALAGKEVQRGDVEALATHVSAEADETSGFVRVSATGATPGQAEALSHAFSTALVKYLDRLKDARIVSQEADLLEIVTSLEREGASELVIQPYRDARAQLIIERLGSVPLETLAPPVAAEVDAVGYRAPESRTSRVLLGAGLGLLAGLALVLILERIDTRIRTRERAERDFALPVLAEIPVVGKKEQAGISLVVNPTGKAADAFRLLSASVVGAWVRESPPGVDGNGSGAAGPHTILVTSPGPGDGKTTVAANLAAAYGELGKHVMIISCDLRRPTIHRPFHVTVSPGLSELLLSGNGSVPHAVPTDVSNVSLLPSGASPDSPGELLASDRMRRVLDQAAASADVVILDCSPVLVASDIAPLLPMVDAVVLVTRAGKTNTALAQRTTEVLRGLGAPVVGVVLNCAREITMPTSYRDSYYRPVKQGKRKSQKAKADGW